MALSSAPSKASTLAGRQVSSAPTRLGRKAARKLICLAGKPATKSVVTFEPFNEVKGELATVSKTDTASESLARLNWHEECEAAVNEQINVEYNISYVYHALHSYFNRDNVGLPGLAKYFKESSDEEREHAQLLMNLQSVRGGRVKLLGIVPPESEFNNDVKGEALYAMELSLSLEKLNFAKLRQLHDIACKHNDAQFADFIEGYLLQEQAKDVKKAAVYVSMLRRVGPGHGTWHFDQRLYDESLGDVAQLGA